MTALLFIIQFIFGIAQFLVGIIANGIIIMVSGLEYIKRKRVTAYDLLLTSLGIFRIFLQVLVLMTNLILLFTLESYVVNEVFIIFFFINEVNLWLATYLCVFYCVKIANIVHPFFLWLKMRISRLVPWLILWSLLISAALAMFHSLLYCPGARQELRRFLFGNITSQALFQYLFPTPILVVGLAMPLCMFNAASFLLIYSLCTHTRRMRSTATGFRDSSTEAHICAMKLVFSFLILYSFYYVGIMTLFSTIPVQRSLLFMFFSVAAFYPSGHSVILILGSSKLKHYTRKFLLSPKCCLGEGSALASTQNQ
ncbi:taste receptor type 2 member 1-like [Trichosurus vulpecula]|uniref:taste receptor type 2 member 1-like n=1 Tax=Trichosurus vulpecula TaxID=9337 RepID=UPI00186B3EB8|nr:taste receptor type 2 member 1-like [Trichosurus vulpecula]